MSSILTNNSAMTALSTLRGINKQLNMTQTEVSTGKRVATSKENAAIWAVSAVMNSDVAGFKGVSDALALGSTTVGVARAGTETIVDLLNQMKERISLGQADNVDATKIQADVDALRSQVNETLNSSQFNGVNLLVTGGAGAGVGQVDVLASLNRDVDGNVTRSNISVAVQGLEFASPTAAAGTFTGTTGASAGAESAAAVVTEGTAYDIVIGTAVAAAGGFMEFQLGTDTVRYTVTAAEAGDAALQSAAFAAAINTAATNNPALANISADGTTTGGTVSITLDDTDAGTTISSGVQARAFDLTANVGGLGQLGAIDVTVDAAQALDDLETLIQNATAAASTFGSAQARIETQSEFIKDLSDSLKIGIGGLVDADMEETSARLQALQVQQQLGVQSLSIANQQPQTLLSLFR